MNEQERKELKAKAIRSLESFLRTGQVGFFQQAKDRCIALGLRAEGHQSTRLDAVNLKEHLILWH